MIPKKTIEQLSIHHNVFPKDKLYIRYPEVGHLYREDTMLMKPYKYLIKHGTRIPISNSIIDGFKYYECTLVIKITEHIILITYRDIEDNTVVIGKDIKDLSIMINENTVDIEGNMDPMLSLNNNTIMI